MNKILYYLNPLRTSLAPSLAPREGCGVDFIRTPHPLPPLPLHESCTRHLSFTLAGPSPWLGPLERQPQRSSSATHTPAFAPHTQQLGPVLEQVHATLPEGLTLWAIGSREVDRSGVPPSERGKQRVAGSSMAATRPTGRPDGHRPPTQWIEHTKHRQLHVVPRVQ